MLMTLYGGGAIAPSGSDLGPFDHLVIRARRVVGGPAASGRIVAFRGSDGRWLEADGEERRGIASDAAYARHSHLRLHSPARDLMVRFFAEDTDDPPAKAGRELGPYSAVTIGPSELRADGELLADRLSPEQPWMSHRTASTPAIAGAVLGVRSGTGHVPAVPSDSFVMPAVRPGSVATAGADSGTTPTRTAAAPAPEAPAPPPFQFIERVRVDPRIYRARGTAAERDP
jgi:hypothetical protein